MNLFHKESWFIYMEIETLKHVEEKAIHKSELFDISPLRYILRSMLASMFIGFGVIVAFKTGSFFYNEHSPLAYPMAAITFGSAIILIAYAGGDLFTGNTFYYTYTALRKKLSWMKVLKLLATTFTGNVIGACCFAALIYLTGLYDEASVNTFLLSVVEHKMNTSTMELFFRAILCNWLVCLAFFVPMTLKGDGAKMFSMILFVFCFFISGYEHSVANMCTFAIALVLDHGPAISFSGLMHNLIPVISGNIIGGSVFMGWMYYYVNKPYLNE